MDPKRARQFLPFRNRPNKHGSAAFHDQGEKRRNTSMNTGPAKNTYERTGTYVRTFWQAIWHPVSDPLAAVAHKSTFPCGKALTRYLADHLAGKRVHVHSPSRDHIARKRRFLEGGRSARRWTAPTTAGRPCEMFSSGPARRPGVAYRHHRTRAEPRESSATIADAIPRQAPSAPHRRRSSKHASSTTRYLHEEMQRASVVPDRSDTTEKSARCGPDPTRGPGGRQEPVTARHAARVVTQRNRAAETNPMNVPSGDFEKEKSRRVTSAESGAALERTAASAPGDRRRSPRPSVLARPATQPHRLTRADCAEPTACVTVARATARLARAETRVVAEIGCRSAARCPEARKRHNEPIRRNAIARRNTTKQHGAATHNDDTPHRDSDPLTQPCQPRTARETSAPTTDDMRHAGDGECIPKRNDAATPHRHDARGTSGGTLRRRSANAVLYDEAPQAGAAGSRTTSPRNLTCARLDEAPRRRRLRLAGVRKPARRAAPG